MENKTKKISFAYAFPIALIAAGLLCAAVFIVIAMIGYDVRIKLYNDIGALPWKDPEINISAEKSERYTDDEIQLAIDAAIKTYKRDWHTYNGVYLLELYYDDAFSENHRNDNVGDWIYLKSVVYTGYADTVDEKFRGKLHSEAYWAVEQLSDGSWICHGCGELEKDE